MKAFDEMAWSLSLMCTFPLLLHKEDSLKYIREMGFRLDNNLHESNLGSFLDTM